MVSVCWRWSRTAGEEGSLAGRCSSCTAHRAAGCKRICCCFNCTATGRREAVQVEGQLGQPGELLSYGRTGTALGNGSLAGLAARHWCKEERKSCAQRGHAYPVGIHAAPQSSTASQSRGHTF